jgi:large subunit ribosomal protein L30
MAIKVKLVKSSSSASARQLATISGLGLSKFGSERVLKDSPALRGMIDKVQHLIRVVEDKA